MTDSYIWENKIVNKITNDLDNNYKVIKKYYKDPDGALIYCFHYSNIIEEDKLLLILETLLKHGANPNRYVDNNTNNYLNFSILNGFSENFIIEALKIGLKYKLKINNSKEAPYTMGVMHYFGLDSCKYKGNIMNIYNVLKENKYDIFTTYGQYELLDKYLEKNKENIYDYDLFVEQFKTDYNNLIDNKIKELEYKYLRVVKEQGEILGEIVTMDIDENISYAVLKYMFKIGIDPNAITIFSVKRNFIEDASIFFHSIEYLIKITELAIKYGLDVNHINNKNETILHVLVKDTSRYRKVLPLYKLLKDNNFDDEIKDDNRRNIYDTIIRYKNIVDKEEFKKYYNYLKELENIDINQKNIEKEYLYKITPSNDKEYNKDIDFNKIDKTIYYLSKPLLLLKGKEGSGKSTLLDKLKCDINEYYKKDVFSTSFKDIINSCLTIGDFKNIFFNILKICSMYNITLFIDDFDEILNLSETDRQQIEIIINYFINKKCLKIIGTINEKNTNNIYSDILFNDIEFYNIKEPNNNELIKVMEYYGYKILVDNNINISKGNYTADCIVEILLCLNKINTTNNVSIIKIVEDIFKKIYEYSINYEKEITKNHIIYAIRNCSYINEQIKNIIIEELTKSEDIVDKNNINNIVKKLTK